MKRFESVKRIIVLWLSFVGLVMQTAVYAYIWMEYYYPLINNFNRGLKFHRNGHLLVIGILKQVLSISDIAEIISAQLKQYEISIAYNYFCEELENALRVTFDGRDFGEIANVVPTKVTPLSKKVRSAVLSFANKIYVKQSIYFDLHIAGKKLV